MRNKHNHQKNNLTKNVLKRVKLLEKKNLRLAIKLKYTQLLNKNDCFKSIHLIRHIFKQVSLSKILSIIKFPKSSYYYHQKATLSKRNDPVEKYVYEIIKKHHAYGYRRITATFRNNGVLINHKRIQRIMQRNHWQCRLFGKRKRKYNSYKGHVGHIAPNILNGNFSSYKYGSKLTTDVSEFRYGSEDINHRVYLSPIMDLYSDKIISYGISDHPTVSFTLKPLIKALKSLKNLSYQTIVHSDQGIQYQSHQWVNTLKQYQAIQSMSRKGTCLDNAQMESFFHIMKAEIMDKHYETKASLIQAMKFWIKDYNNNRIKEKLGYQSPNQYLALIS